MLRQTCPPPRPQIQPFPLSFLLPPANGPTLPQPSKARGRSGPSDDDQNEVASFKHRCRSIEFPTHPPARFLSQPSSERPLPLQARLPCITLTPRSNTPDPPPPNSPALNRLLLLQVALPPPDFLYSSPSPPHRKYSPILAPPSPYKRFPSILAPQISPHPTPQSMVSTSFKSACSTATSLQNSATNLHGLEFLVPGPQARPHMPLLAPPTA